jgi:hypothetical protein
MQEQYFSRITKGMDVYDMDGDKVGTVGEIYQPAEVTSTTAATARPTGRMCLKVDTGFLGLGKDLFIPADAVSNVTTDQVTLNVDKDRLDDMGWDRRPDWLTDDRF